MKLSYINLMDNFCHLSFRERSYIMLISYAKMLANHRNRFLHWSLMESANQRAKIRVENYLLYLKYNPFYRKNKIKHKPVHNRKHFKIILNNAFRDPFKISNVDEHKYCKAGILSMLVDLWRKYSHWKLMWNILSTTSDFQKISYSFWG